MNHPNLPAHNPNATVADIDGWVSLDSNVTHVVIDHYVSEPDFAEVDLSRLSQLKTLEIGNHCFTRVKDWTVVGLRELECVVIGTYCATQASGRFCVKNCPSLNELKIGRFSFEDYSVCVIENVDALEAMAIGDVNDWSNNFFFASLELKSVSAVLAVMIRYAFSQIRRDWLERVSSVF